MTNRLDHYEIAIIVPKEVTNWVTNPSFELATTGYTAYGAGVSIARSASVFRRGGASCDVTTATGVASGLYYAITLTSGTQYSFSADILDVAGQTFTLSIVSSADAAKSDVTSWTGTGYWKRRSVTWTADATATFWLKITRASVASTTHFWVDGVQLEVGAVSTYLDGDMRGFLRGQTAYRWNGTPHASTSWRSGETRSGGTYMKFSTYAKIIGLVGLGMATLTNHALPSNLGGSHYQNTVWDDRLFSVVMNINSGAATGDSGAISRARAYFHNAVNPYATQTRQPLLVQIDQYDSGNLEIAETLQIKALYQSGLEAAGDYDAYNSRESVTFKAFLPLLFQDGENSIALGYQTSVADANYILMRTPAGVWQAMASGTNGAVNTICPASDGSVYIGGGFTNLTDANGDYISKWNGTAFSSLGTGANGEVFSIVEGPDGKIYAAGGFTSMGGVANTSRIAYWDGTWHALGTGANDNVRSIAFGPNGTLYAGGDFTSMGGVADTTRVAKWDGSVWTPLATGTGDIVRAVSAASDGSVYIGGDFTNLTDANGDYISKWNGSAFVSMGTGANQAVYSLNVGHDGTIYAGGAFTLMGGVVNTSKIAQWNGTAWLPLGTGANLTVHTLKSGSDGLLYAGGTFTAAGGVTLPDRMAIWTGSQWVPLDVNLTGTPTVSAVDFDKTGNLYVGYSVAGTAASATVTTPNVTGNRAYPIVTYTGPGKVYQLVNYTTYQKIYFDLTLLAGETAVLDLRPDTKSFTSSFRGDIWYTILPGSNTNFWLQNGANSVSSYIFGSTTAASGVGMTFSNSYVSIDQAVR